MQQAVPLTQEFLDRLRSFVRRRVPRDVDADDIVQEVLAKLVAKGGEVQSGSVHAWLFTVARRAIIDHFRTRRGHDQLPEEVSGEDPESCDGTAASELALCLEPMLVSLGEADRSILSRVDMAGESQATIARELGLSPSAVKSRVQRARSRLLAVLDACCAVERDCRGAPVDYTRSPDRDCPCSPGQGKPPCC
jgi:RNA polymerase sigma-70 factor (ECF subfamily)